MNIANVADPGWVGAGLGALTANFRFSTFAAMGKLCLESAVTLNSGLYCVLANFSIFVLRFKFTFYETLDSLKFSLRQCLGVLKTRKPYQHNYAKIAWPERR